MIVAKLEREMVCRGGGDGRGRGQRRGKGRGGEDGVWRWGKCLMKAEAVRRQLLMWHNFHISTILKL